MLCQQQGMWTKQFWAIVVVSSVLDQLPTITLNSIHLHLISRLLIIMQPPFSLQRPMSLSVCMCQGGTFLNNEFTFSTFTNSDIKIANLQATVTNLTGNNLQRNPKTKNTWNRPDYIIRSGPERFIIYERNKIFQVFLVLHFSSRGQLWCFKA